MVIRRIGRPEGKQGQCASYHDEQKEEQLGDIYSFC